MLKSFVSSAELVTKPKIIAVVSAMTERTELFDRVQSLYYRDLSDEVVYLILSLAAGVFDES